MRVGEIFKNYFEIFGGRFAHGFAAAGIGRFGGGGSTPAGLSGVRCLGVLRRRLLGVSSVMGRPLPPSLGPCRKGPTVSPTRNPEYITTQKVTQNFILLMHMRDKSTSTSVWANSEH